MFYFKFFYKLMTHPHHQRLSVETLFMDCLFTNNKGSPQKSFFYKVVKAGKLEEAVIDTFKAKCDEAETRGEDPNRSLEGLLKFAKAVETGATATGEGEDSEGGDASEAQVETRIETILTFTYKSEGGNVSVRIDAEGNVKTTNSAEQIREAIAVLNFSYQNQYQ